MRRVFLDWQQPTLIAVVDWLVSQYQQADPWDLKELVIVLPGARAGRRLRELLLQRSDAEQVALFPPDIVTMGHLPELLYRPQRPLADELIQRLAWGESIRQLDPHARKDILAALDPKPENLGEDWSVLRWLEIGGRLQQQYRELAAEGLSFSEVARRGQQIPDFRDQAHWNALSLLQEGYLGRLDALGIWDRQTGRLVAVRQHEYHSRQQLILVGMTDIHRSLQQMLDAVSAQVTVLIAAPAEYERAFDRLGCVVPAAWENVEVPLEDRQIVQVDRPRDQINKVAEIMASYDGAFSGGEITIGIPDQRMVPAVKRSLSGKHVAVRWGPGDGIAETGPYRLLEQVARWVDSRRFVDFALLARHPDVLTSLRQRGSDDSWLMALDRFYNQQLPSRLPHNWYRHGSGVPQEVTQAAAAIDQIVGVLSQPRRQTLSQWTSGIMDLLMTVFGDARLRYQEIGDRMILRSCEAFQSALIQCKQVPDGLFSPVSASEALSILLSQVHSTRVPPPGDPEAVEILGWLELALDDAPALIVTHFNEGSIPEPVRSEFFLSDAVRQQLGLPDQRQRYARDAHALNVMLASRKCMHVIVGKHDPDGDPLVPSRLLFATDQRRIARRAEELFGSLHSPPQHSGSESPESPSQFELPHPRKIPPIVSLRVTDFKNYLQCPYRFYLSRVLKLRAINDEADELDGASFGNLLHDVLSDFGRGPESNSTDRATILEYLTTQLDRLAAQRFAEEPLAALKIQLVQMKMRLAVFSEMQAQRAAEGWRITQVEEPDQAMSLEVDGTSMEIVGRIDRIDRHESTGKTIIWDYKSSDAGERPETAHRRRRTQWVDLQLPLYRHLARYLGLPSEVGLGFINLPKEEANAGFHLADWTETDLQTADDVVSQVIRDIRNQTFWPPSRPAPKFSEEFAYLCQDGVMEPPRF